MELVQLAEPILMNSYHQPSVSAPNNIALEFGDLGKDTYSIVYKGEPVTLTVDVYGKLDSHLTAYQLETAFENNHHITTLSLFDGEDVVVIVQMSSVQENDLFIQKELNHL